MKYFIIHFSWWNPRFDSQILEEQYWTSTMPRTTRRFQFGLVYLLLLSLVFSIYFPAMRTSNWTLFLCISLGILVTVAMTLGVTLTSIYQKHVWKISVALSLVRPTFPKFNSYVLERRCTVIFKFF
jgi:adenylate cyclase 9